MNRLALVLAMTMAGCFAPVVEGDAGLGGGTAQGVGGGTTQGVGGGGAPGVGGGGAGVGGGGAGIGGGGEGGNDGNSCDPVGVWKLNYTKFTTSSECQIPEDEQLVVTRLADGSLVSSLDLHGTPSCGGDAEFVDATRSATFDRDTCMLTLSESVHWCYSGEDGCNTRQLSMHIDGDTLSGVGSLQLGELCECQGQSNIDGLRVSTSNAGQSSGTWPGCAAPVMGTCQPVGTWQLSYSVEGANDCAPQPGLLTITQDTSGAFAGQFDLSGGTGACAGSSYPHPPSTSFDPARCELVISNELDWCDPAGSYDQLSEQRSLAITFAGDVGVGYGYAASSSCGNTQGTVCVTASRH